MRRFLIPLSFLAILIQSLTATASEKKVEILYIGSYHTSNHGADVNNFAADNIFQPKRQKELDRLVNAISTFRPNGIMIEESAPPPTFASAYFADFKSEKLQTQADELTQIALRLAAKLKLTAVHGIDERAEAVKPDYFPYEKVEVYAAAYKKRPSLQP